MNTAYRTTDIALAAFLHAQGLKVDRIEKIGRRGTFCYDEVPQRFITDFQLGRASVEPLAFYHAIRQLTTAVRETISG